jgi:tetratricopeptide (TPR) repeat protein
MKTRRDRRTLERAIDEAQTREERAAAHYELAVFHDNNSREAEAIPHYEQALQLGLDQPTRVQALAWLASSLYKTGKPRAALARAEESLSGTQDAQLTRFLIGLR